MPDGIRKGYPHLERHIGKIIGYIQLCRPFTLVAPLLAGLFGVLAPVESITFHHLLTAIYVGLTLAFAQACGQCINQYADAELDKLTKSYRPIPSGFVTREEALGVGWLLALFSIGRAFTINLFFGLTVLTLIFFAVFYSLAPLSPRKIHPLVNTGWMALSRGLLPMLAVWSIYGDINQAWPYAIIAFIWVMGWQASKDIPDVNADKAYGIKTIPNTWGVKGLQVTMAICLVWFGTAAIFFNLLGMLLLLPLGITALVTIKKQASLTENTYSWICYYLGLGLIYIIAFVTAKI